MDKSKVYVISCVGGAGASLFWTSWLKSLRDLGYDVNEVFSVTGARYRSPSGMWARFSLRFDMYVTILFRIVKVLLSAPKGSTIIATTNPFFVPWLMGLLAGPHRKVVILMYDLYPDSLVVGGVLKADSWVAKAMTSLNGFALKRSAMTVFLGRRMEQHIRERMGADVRSAVIPVGADAGAFPPPSRVTTDRPTEILYCGNLGALHETDLLIHGLSKSSFSEASSPAFRFHTSGLGVEAFRAAVEANGLAKWITFGPSMSNGEWEQAMRGAQVGLVLLKRKARLSAVPSKVYSAMAAGQAILAVCPYESDLADLVLESDCGWVVEPEDIDGLRSLLLKLGNDSNDLWEKRTNAYHAANERYSMPVVAEAWDESIATL